MNLYQGDDEARNAARRAWCDQRTVGQLTATFGPGDELRCPASRRLSGGSLVVCGNVVGQAKENSKVIVRVLSGRSGEMPHPGTETRCSSCRAALEVFPILEAAG